MTCSECLFASITTVVNLTLLFGSVRVSLRLLMFLLWHLSHLPWVRYVVGGFGLSPLVGMYVVDLYVTDWAEQVLFTGFIEHCDFWLSLRFSC
ncbi:hypothetical protein B0T22DRAFT_62116 [Podospora appendiculata]|uniref:Uncharacterized protein n=1 Tax=Podospora appendiculata TaxID=314037 RepID=A0AAE0XIL4_9PEZI|nr:hypothetical protein B0T22DRAFT_62116 [Podospora appendiculata]